MIPRNLREAASWYDQEYERVLRRRDQRKLMDRLRGETVTQRSREDSNIEGRLQVLAEAGCLLRSWASRKEAGQ